LENCNKQERGVQVSTNVSVLYPCKDLIQWQGFPWTKGQRSQAIPLRHSPWQVSGYACTLYGSYFTTTGL